IHAYFPDQTTEVTSALKLSSVTGGVAFTYVTPPLTSGSLNQFSIEVSRLSESSRSLEVLLAQTELQICFLKLEIDRRNRSELTTRLANLESLKTETQAKLNQRGELLAEYRLPLQVDNATAAPGYILSVIGDLAFSISFDPGSAIQGMNAQALGSIEELGHESDEVLGKFFWQGVQ